MTVSWPLPRKKAKAGFVMREVKVGPCAEVSAHRAVRSTGSAHVGEGSGQDRLLGQVHRGCIIV